MVTEGHKKLILIGFNTDYQRMEVSELSGSYDVIHLPMNFFLYFMLGKLKSDYVNKSVVKKYYEKKMAKLGINNYTVILTDDPIDIYAVLSFKIDDVRVLMRNSVLDGKKILSLISGCQVYSFDSADCKMYKFKSVGQYIPCEKILRKHMGNNNEFDFFFLGLDKGRKNKIDALDKHLKGLNYKTYFQIKYSPNGFWQRVDKWIKKNNKYRMLSYEENLDIASRSKCIVEIVQDGQVGITLRTLEALFLKKKLITNNFSIIDTELFNDANVLAFKTLEDLEPSRLREFIERPFCDYPDDALEKYTITYNIKMLDVV